MQHTPIPKDSKEPNPSGNDLKPIPETSPKINLEKLAHFMPRIEHHLSHHVYHAFHHDFTIKTPRSAHRFSQKPLQKPSFTSQKKSAAVFNINSATLILSENDDRPPWTDQLPCTSRRQV
jgi:hypothetical protein